MPVVSRSQAGLMGMTQTPAGRAKAKRLGIKLPSAAVGHEFLQASKGMKFRKLPTHHRGVERATKGKSL